MNKIMKQFKNSVLRIEGKKRKNKHRKFKKNSILRFSDVKENSKKLRKKMRKFIYEMTQILRIYGLCFNLIRLKFQRLTE